MQPPPPPPPYKMAENDIFFETRRMGRKKEKKPFFFFFSKFSFFRCFFLLFLFFLGVLDHVLRPPCRRYGGDSFTKKVENAKNQFTYFSVFRYSKPFGPHATSNVCIYFRQKPFYGHPVGDRAECLLQKR